MFEYSLYKKSDFLEHNLFCISDEEITEIDFFVQNLEKFKIIFLVY